jgi:hypothetical protein
MVRLKDRVEIEKILPNPGEAIKSKNLYFREVKGSVQK